MKAKRNKKYRPRPVATAGGLGVIANCYARGEEHIPLRDEQLTDLGVAYWLSMENLRTGAATEEAWSCVVSALNIAMALCEDGIGIEFEGDFNRALAGAWRAKVRSAKSGNFRLDGPAIIEITAALHLHDQQLKLATRAQVTKALNLVHDRIEEGNVYTLEAA
jgi:hypothetical protein